MRWARTAFACIFLTFGTAPIATHAQQSSAEYESMQELATQFYQAGQYKQAMQFSEQALALAIKQFGPDHERISMLTYGLGLTAEKAGDDNKAVQYYGQSVSIREKVYGKEAPGIAEALDLYGSALMRLDRVDEAEPVFRRALKLRKDILGFEHAYQAGSTANLGAVAVAKGRYREALVMYRKAIKLLASQKTDFVVANQVMNQGLKRQRSAFIGLAQAVWHGGAQVGLNKRAAFDESFKASQDAWRTSAAEAIAKMTARLGTANSPLGRDVSKMQKLADEIVALNEQDMRELARWSKVQRQDVEFSKILEEMRATSIRRHKASQPDFKRQRALAKDMQDLIKRCPPGQKKAGCDGTMATIKQLGAELTKFSKAAAAGNSETMAVINKMNSAEKKLPGYQQFSTTRKTRVQRMTKLGIERRALKKRIVSAHPSYAALADPAALNGAQASQLLSPDEALITMLVGHRKSFIWVITRDNVAWSEIDAGERQLAADVAKLRLGLDPLAAEQNPDAAGDFDFETAHRLYKTIFDPIERHIAGKKHLILVPNGPLTSLPLQVLITRKAQQRATPEDTVRDASWLIRNYALSVLPSVQSLASLRRLQRTAKSRKPFIGIGDPVLKGGEQGTSRGAKTANRTAAKYYTRGLADVRAVSAMTPLPDTADELRAIGRVLGASQNDILLQDVANETSVKARKLNDYRIVHFATHGLVAGDLTGLNEPALVLTPPPTATKQDDGLLTASEIATLSLDADWVVLSACNTAAGSAVGAEALSGLARAFFYSGARALLVSHWAVYSDAAVKLTTRTFSALKRDPGLGRAEAFRQSMLALIKDGQPPAYWAPFVIVGEGGAQRIIGWEVSL